MKLTRIGDTVVRIGAKAVAKLFFSWVSADCSSDRLRFTFPVLVSRSCCARLCIPSVAALLILLNNANRVRIPNTYFISFLRDKVLLFADLWMPKIPLEIFCRPPTIALDASCMNFDISLSRACQSSWSFCFMPVIPDCFNFSAKRRADSASPLNL